MAALSFRHIAGVVRDRFRPREDVRTQLEQLRARTHLVFGSDALRQARTILDRDYLEGVRVAIAREGIVVYSKAENPVELEHAEGILRLNENVNSLLRQIPRDLTKLSERRLFVILHALAAALEGLEHTILDLRVSPLRGVSEDVTSALVRAASVMIIDVETSIGAIKDQIGIKTGINLNAKPIIE